MECEISNVKKLFWDAYEVLKQLPSMLGGSCGSCSTRLGGSSSKGRIRGLEGRCNARQINFKQKTDFRRCRTISNQLTSMI